VPLKSKGYHFFLRKTKKSFGVNKYFWHGVCKSISEGREPPQGATVLIEFINNKNKNKKK
jgi:hypothetical protein